MSKKIGMDIINLQYTPRAGRVEANHRHGHAEYVKHVPEQILTGGIINL